MTPPLTRVVIASDIRLYREGLAAILARDGQLETAETAVDLGQTLTAIAESHPAVLLLDMGMPDAFSTIREVATHFPKVKTVALGISESRRDVIACAEAGVTGYVCRESALDDLVAVVRSSEAGELRCSRRIAAVLLQRVAVLAAGGRTGGAVRLTPRELEIAELIEQGLTNKEIGRRLRIQISTAKNHVHSILEKLGTHTRGEAVAKLRRLGFFRPGHVAAVESRGGEGAGARMVLSRP